VKSANFFAENWEKIAENFDHNIDPGHSCGCRKPTGQTAVLRQICVILFFSRVVVGASEQQRRADIFKFRAKRRDGFTG
jgi:hypothetical protein